MLILFDHGVPAPLVPYLIGHAVVKARERGWDRLSNGDLLAEAERAGFDVFLTADKNIRYQQNLTGRRIAIVVLSTPQWAGGSIARCRNCGGSERGHAWQLCRRSDSAKVLKLGGDPRRGGAYSHLLMVAQGWPTPTALMPWAKKVSRRLEDLLCQRKSVFSYLS
jgi:hypothetical protein